MGDNWSSSTALGVKTGEELDKFVGAELGSRGAVTDSGGFPSDPGPVSRKPRKRFGPVNPFYADTLYGNEFGSSVVSH